MSIETPAVRPMGSFKEVVYDPTGSESVMHAAKKCSRGMKICAVISFLLAIGLGTVIFIFMYRDVIVEVTAKSFSEMNFSYDSQNGILYVNGTFSPKLLNPNYVSISTSNLEMVATYKSISIDFNFDEKYELKARGEQIYDIEVNAVFDSVAQAQDAVQVAVTCGIFSNFDMDLKGSLDVSHPLRSLTFTVDESVKVPC